jgi:hypothetical protein
LNPRRLSMRPVPIVLSLVLASAGALAFAFGGGGTDPVEPPPPPVNTVFAGVLVRVGLGADSLAAAGISQSQVASLVGALEGQYNPATLASLDEAFIQAKQDHDRLRRKVTSGLGSQQDVAALRTAETTLATATLRSRSNAPTGELSRSHAIWGVSDVPEQRLLTVRGPTSHPMPCYSRSSTRVLASGRHNIYHDVSALISQHTQCGRCQRRNRILHISAHKAYRDVSRRKHKLD